MILILKIIIKKLLILDHLTFLYTIYINVILIFIFIYVYCIKLKFFLYYFFRRCRGIKPGQSPYVLNFDSLQVTENEVDVELINTANDAKFKLTLSALVDDTFRLFANEISPLYPRYVVEISLDKPPQHDK